MIDSFHLKNKNRRGERDGYVDRFNFSFPPSDKTFPLMHITFETLLFVVNILEISSVVKNVKKKNTLLFSRVSIFQQISTPA